MNDYLYHHGIKGQRWGVRRYQNEDGSYTNAGKQRYSEKQNRHETAWYQKAKESTDLHPGHGYVKQRVSKSSGSELNSKLKLRDQQTWGKAHNLEDSVKRQQETFKKHGYDVSEMNMFESREVNSQKNMDARIARQQILDRRNVTEQNIHELLESEELIEEIEEESVEEGKSFIDTAKEFFKKIFK